MVTFVYQINRVQIIYDRRNRTVHRLPVFLQKKNEFERQGLTTARTTCMFCLRIYQTNKAKKLT